ncbi:peptidase domain-containing ABC transporter [Pelistega ratti]|uniref:peptidase domain-containing ABC transporter n=1 Tax=Pelistega ratti TaxID=2652177 RepID=UPI00135BB989|nr:peptidase domain-containing ABC transporter [Pelistega ratti]
MHKLSFDFFRKVPVILQSEINECGLACLAMVRGFYGDNLSLSDLKRQYGFSLSRGMNLKNLIDIAQQLNFMTRAVSLNLEELYQLKLPCILHWDFNHFVVLVKASKNTFTIHDPAFGKRKITKNELSMHFTGIALEIWANIQFNKNSIKSDKINLYELFKNIVGLKSSLLKIFALSLLIELIGLLMPMGMQLVTDHIMHAKDKPLLLVVCLGLFFFMFFRSSVSMLRAWISLKMNYLIDFQWTASFFSHLLKLPLDFFEKRRVGDIQSRFASLRTIQKTLTGSVVSFIINTIMVISLFTMMLIYGGWLTWIIFGFSFLYLLLRAFTYFTYRRLNEEQIIKQAKVSSHFMESLYGITTLKLGLNKKREEYWMSLNADTFNTSIRIAKFDMMFSGIYTFIETFEQILVLGLGALLVIENQMTLGMFIAFNAYRGSFSGRIESLINIIFSLKMLSLHLDRISDIALQDTEKDNLRYIVDNNEGRQLGKIEVRNLCFQYDQLGKELFSNLNLTIDSGESVAIVAPSGYGKTTLLKLMAGLLIPNKGGVYFNEKDIIHQIGVNNYRQYIAYVLQNDKFFSGTILENITGFEDEYDMNWVIECARIANIHDEIMLMPMQYETILSELGGNLSGGQQQRLFIARAIYKKPQVIFMDEATSHLDRENEKIINKAIKNLSITRIIIAHRESTLQSVDRIIHLPT